MIKKIVFLACMGCMPAVFSATGPVEEPVTGAAVNDPSLLIRVAVLRQTERLRVQVQAIHDSDDHPAVKCRQYTDLAVNHKFIARDCLKLIQESGVDVFDKCHAYKNIGAHRD